MDNPELYSQTNVIPRAAATQFLDEYASKIKWKASGDSIIDLGCGDGSVTCILKKYIPNNYDIFIACDINKKMIEYAREQHCDENITFTVFDVQSVIPDELRRGFNHVFSFLMLHWIPNQEQAFKTIYDLMNAGGDCFVTIVATNPINNLFDVVGRDPNKNWGSTWIKNLSTFVSIYCHMEDPEKYITDIMKNIGFINIDVKLRNMSYEFENIVAYKRFVKALEPYGMPDDVFEDFFQDFISAGKDSQIINEDIDDLNDLKNKVDFKYNIIVIHAGKSEESPH